MVEDSIEMTRIIDPDVRYSSIYAPKIQVSPDRKYFAIATRKGNLATGKNDYTLILYQSDEVLAFVNETDNSKGKSDFPKGRVLVRVSTSLNEAAFQQLAWVDDSQALAFIGWFDPQDGDTSGQVYKLDINSNHIQKLTNHPRSVTRFALNSTSQKILYASSVSRRNEDGDKTSYLAGVRNINHIVNPDWEYPEPAVQYYIQTIGRPGHSQAVGQVYKGFFQPNIWLSPNGGKAVVVTARNNPPRHWLDGYDHLKSDFGRIALEGFDEDTMMPREDLTTQYGLIDISNASIRPVFDAPTGLWVAGQVGALWLPDSASVILANTALPLDSADAKENKGRHQKFSTVEYNLNTGFITHIIDHAAKESVLGPGAIANSGTSGGRFFGFSIDSTGLLKIEQLAKRENLPDTYFEKKNGLWVQLTAPLSERSPDNNDRLDIAIQQDANIPPELMATDNITERKRVISDFNPLFRNLTFGKVVATNWEDQTGRHWQGGIVYPPNLEEGKKYPLVIQTHGFYPKQFLIDGPNDVASAFAAQALANNGMVVLQMQNLEAPQDRNSRLHYQKGFEAAIDHMDVSGLIEREKVGLIGWSATGLDVQQMLLHSEYPIAAATIADSYNIGVFGYVNQFGARAPGMAHIEEIAGGVVPWGGELDSWVANNPTLHLDRLKTPLRYEQYENNLSSWWGTYAFLRRQHKPVEYFVFNDASHQIMKPAHRLSSQQGNVDWFSFWLKDEEDLDPAKADQYKRWHKLREQQEKSVPAAIAARKRADAEKANRARYREWLNSQTAANDDDAMDIDVVVCQ